MQGSTLENCHLDQLQNCVAFATHNSTAMAISFSSSFFWTSFSLWHIVPPLPKEFLNGVMLGFLVTGKCWILASPFGSNKCLAAAAAAAGLLVSYHSPTAFSFIDYGWFTTVALGGLKECLKATGFLRRSTTTAGSLAATACGQNKCLATVETKVPSTMISLHGATTSNQLDNGGGWPPMLAGCVSSCCYFVSGCKASCWYALVTGPLPVNMTITLSTASCWDSCFWMIWICKMIFLLIRCSFFMPW